jgi:thiamine-phosphate pyrophosphorylase
LPPAPEKPIVCYVTDRKALGSSDSARSVLEKIRAAAEARVDWVQIREKDLPARELLALTRKAVAMAEARAAQTRIVVSDRLDVALAAGAAGVHLGHESAAAGEVVRWCRAGNAPAGFLIGASCHSLEEARVAENAGADYIFFGPIFDSPSKRSFGAPQGIARLAEVCRAVRIPTIAIGGVNESNAAECLRAGGAGIAAIRMFQEHADARSLENALAAIRRLA